MPVTSGCQHEWRQNFSPTWKMNRDYTTEENYYSPTPDGFYCIYCRELVRAND